MAKKTCPHCGALVDSNRSVCPNCRADIREKSSMTPYLDRCRDYRYHHPCRCGPPPPSCPATHDTCGSAGDRPSGACSGKGRQADLHHRHHTGKKNPPASIQLQVMTTTCFTGDITELSVSVNGEKKGTLSASPGSSGTFPGTSGSNNVVVAAKFANGAESVVYQNAAL